MIMAAKKRNANDLNIPESTGAVETPGPESWSLESDNSSTGAVEYQAPGESVNNASNEASVTFATPTEPVTFTASWLSEAEAKVITAQHQSRVNGSAVAETKDADTGEGDDAAEAQPAGEEAAAEAPAAVEPAAEAPAAPEAPAEGAGE